MPADDRGRDPFVLLLLMGLGLLLSLTFFTTTALEPDPVMRTVKTVEVR